MRTRSKLALIGLGATLLMAFAVNTAAARNLSISATTYRSTFNNLEFSANGVTVTCHVTLEGTLHSRSIVKRELTLIGNITRVDTAACSGNVTVLRETLPWNVRYISFSGRLPDITLLTFRVTPRFLIEPGLGFRCQALEPIDFRFTRNTSTGALSEVTIPTQNTPVSSGGGFGCPSSSGQFRSAGSGSIDNGSGTRLTVTLI